jgi:hypothetical protein
MTTTQSTNMKRRKFNPKYKGKRPKNKTEENFEL